MNLNSTIANIVITAPHTHGGPEYLGPSRQFLHQRALKANNGTDPHELIDYGRHLGAKAGKLSDETSAERANNANDKVRPVAPLSLKKDDQ